MLAGLVYKDEGVVEKLGIVVGSAVPVGGQGP